MHAAIANEVVKTQIAAQLELQAKAGKAKIVPTQESWSNCTFNKLHAIQPELGFWRAVVDLSRRDKWFYLDVVLGIPE